MSKRIYTFEVEIDDQEVHGQWEDGGPCDHDATVSCEDSIAETLGMIGREMALMARRGAHLLDKVDFIESYSENEWDDLIHSEARQSAIALYNRYSPALKESGA